MKPGSGQFALYSSIFVTAAILLWQTCQPVLAAGDESAYALHARPSVCVSYNSDEPCTMSLELDWSGPLLPGLCLREQQREQALQCWRNATRGKLDIDFANTADVLYLLQNPATSDSLADTSVKVINRDLRSSRMRRRHVWSIL